MVLQRSSRRPRAAARAQPHASCVSEEKQFSTPRKPSTITQAEIKRASAIFSDVWDDFASESSEKSSEDCATEKFSRRRVDPNFDTIRRKLSFNQKTLTSCKIRTELGFNSVSATFRARKVRGAEQKSTPVDKMVKSEHVDGAEKCDYFVVQAGDAVSPQPQTKHGERRLRNMRGNRDKVKAESVEYSVKQEIQIEPMDVEALRPQRRRTSGRANVKSEYEELTKLVTEESKAKIRLRKRKLDLEVGKVSTGNDTKRRKKESGDHFAVKDSTALVLADATYVTPLPTGVGLALDTESLSASVSLPYLGPYPSHARPYPEECKAVRDLLSDLHGHLPEYERHKVSCPTVEPSTLQNQGAGERGDCAEDCAEDNSAHELTAVVRVEKVQDQVVVLTGHPRERRTVLDSLVGTLLSQNTTDNNSRRAFASLKGKYPTWEDVYRADPNDVEEAIRCGGLAEIKTTRILNILKTLKEERGTFCMEYVRSMSNEEIKTELSRFKGVGPKTVACVLMFHLQRKEFPVDTHVFRISKALGWIPTEADRERAYLHLNQRIPDHLKFDIHCLLVTHGKKCPLCAKRQTKKSKCTDCPLVNWSSKVLKNRSESSVLLLKGSEAA